MLPFLQDGLRYAGATAALPAPLPSPPAQPHQRQGIKQLDRLPPHSASEALSLHLEETISEKASGFLVSRTGTSELMVPVDQKHRGGESRAVKGAVYFLSISFEIFTLQLTPIHPRRGS